MKLSIETDHEDDGRWIAEVPELPGLLAYGARQSEAMLMAETLARGVVAEQLKHGERRAGGCAYHDSSSRTNRFSVTKARVCDGSLHMGCQIKRQSGSHRTPTRDV